MLYIELPSYVGFKEIVSFLKCDHDMFRMYLGISELLYNSKRLQIYADAGQFCFDQGGSVTVQSSKLYYKKDEE